MEPVQQSPTVPLTPEPLERLQRRFDSLPVSVWVIPEDAPDEQLDPRPGNTPACVFDAEDGLRAIASFERIGDSPDAPLHVSLSWPINSPFRQAMLREPSFRKRVSLLAGRIWELAGFVFPLALLGVSEKGVPHFMGPDRDRYLKLRDAARARSAGQWN